MGERGLQATGSTSSRNRARPIEMDYAIRNGFGGANASTLFRRWTDKLADASAGGSRD
jgi:3-oxoacyl-[acyl-carrier-protein] synthase II